MAAQHAAAVSTLRAITYRISSADDDELPRFAGQLAGAVWICKDVLAAPADVKQPGDVSSVLHRFKTQLSTLLQHRSPRSRWTGVVLLKAVIEAGGYETLSKSNGWVRSLLAILKKRDPPTTRILAVLTLTRIFVLTWDHANLVREITTPALPTFIGTCLSNIESKTRCSAAEIATVLEAFAVLIPRHPTGFRPHESAIRAHIATILSSTSIASDSDSHHSAATIDVAGRVSTLLHHCTPKQGASDKWDAAWKSTVASAHTTCDVVFRCVEESWQSSAGVQTHRPRHQLLGGDAEVDATDALGLAPWKGISAGAARLVSLLRVLEQQLELPTAALVSCKVGLAVDLLSRISRVRLSSSDAYGSIQFSAQISCDEREALLVQLPLIHCAAFKLMQTILERLNDAAFSIMPAFMEMILAIYPSSRFSDDLRTQLNATLRTILHLRGSGLSKRDVTEISTILRQSCQALLPSEAGSSKAEDQKPSAGAASSTAASNSKSSATTTATNASAVSRSAGLRASCRALLLTAFATLPMQHVPVKVRTQMDRTAVLTRDKELLAASVLNPAHREKERAAQASLLPILARLYPQETSVEAILRPRMPPLTRPGRPDQGETFAELDTESEDDEGEGEEHHREDHAYAQVDAESSGQDSASQPPASSYATAISSPQKRRRSIEDASEAAGVSAVVPSRIAEPVPAEGAAKRSRLTTPAAAGSLLDDLEAELQSSNAAADADSATINLSVRETVSAGVSAPAPTSSAGAEAVEDDAGDGSDFEMPPLTMELDTEDEDSDGAAEA